MLQLQAGLGANLELRTCSNPACRRLYQPRVPQQRTCRTRCSEALRGRRKRAKRAAATVEQRLDEALYRRNRPLALMRDGYVCRMPVCKQPTRYIWQGAPARDPMSASADHIIARSRGGTSALDNLRASHLGCNSSAGAALGNTMRSRYTSSAPRIAR